MRRSWCSRALCLIGLGTAAFVAAVAVGGCSLLTSLDGFGGGADADAGSEAAPATTTDAAREGGGDGAPPAIAFCKSLTADFCADFDQGARDLGWASSDTRGAGMLDLDATRSTSAPRSLHARWPRIDMGTDNFEQLLATWPGAARPTTLDVDVFVEPIAWKSGDSGLTIEELYFDKSEKTGVLLVLTPTSWLLEIHTPTEIDLTGPGQFPSGAWTHLRIEATPKSSGGSVSAHLDGQLVLQKSGLSFVLNPTETQLWIGLGAGSSPLPPVDVHYDNVVVRFP